MRFRAGRASLDWSNFCVSPPGHGRRPPCRSRRGSGRAGEDPGWHVRAAQAHVRIRTYVRTRLRHGTYVRTSVRTYACDVRTPVRDGCSVCRAAPYCMAEVEWSEAFSSSSAETVHGQVEKAQMDKARDFQKWIQVEYPVELASRIIAWRESLSDAGLAALEKDFFIE